MRQETRIEFLEQRKLALESDIARVETRINTLTSTSLSGLDISAVRAKDNEAQQCLAAIKRIEMKLEPFIEKQGYVAQLNTARKNVNDWLKENKILIHIARGE